MFDEQLLQAPSTVTVLALRFHYPLKTLHAVTATYTAAVYFYVVQLRHANTPYLEDKQVIMMQ